MTKNLDRADRVRKEGIRNRMVAGEKITDTVDKKLAWIFT